MRQLYILCFFFAFARTLQAEPTSIDIWHSMTGDKGALIAKLIAEFNAKPEVKYRIKVVPTYVGGYVDGVNKLRASMMARKVPHIAQIYEIGTQFMIDSHFVEPLEDLVKDDPSFGLS